MSVSLSTLLTRPSLLLRIRDPGDARAWSRFVELYGPFIFEACRRAGLDVEDAADATQEVFLRVVRTIGSFEYSRARGRFRGWLGTLVRHEVAETWSRRRMRDCRDPLARGVESSGTLAWEDGYWEESFAAYIQRVALERVRVRTTKRSWIIFKLTWLVGCPAEKVARRLRLPVSRIFECKCRLLKRLREEVAALSEEAAALVPLQSLES